MSCPEDMRQTRADKVEQMITAIVLLVILASAIATGFDLRKGDYR